MLTLYIFAAMGTYAFRRAMQLHERRRSIGARTSDDRTPPNPSGKRTGAAVHPVGGSSAPHCNEASAAASPSAPTAETTEEALEDAHKTEPDQRYLQQLTSKAEEIVNECESGSYGSPVSCAELLTTVRVTHSGTHPTISPPYHPHNCQVGLSLARELRLQDRPSLLRSAGRRLSDVGNRQVDGGALLNKAKSLRSYLLRFPLAHATMGKALAAGGLRWTKRPRRCTPGLLDQRVRTWKDSTASAADSSLWSSSGIWIAPNAVPLVGGRPTPHSRAHVGDQPPPPSPPRCISHPALRRM